MRVLTEFTLLTRRAESGEELIDDAGYPVICGFKLSFEDGTDDEVSFQNGSGSIAEDLEECARPKAINIVKSDTVAVSEDDVDWLTWFMDLVRIDKETISVAEPPKPEPELVEEGDQEELTAGIELTGDLTGDGIDPELTSEEDDKVSIVATRKATKKGKMRRVGAGCKHPTQVAGWAEGRILSVHKTHRGRGWGKCFYQIECVAGGGYKLLQFKGNRTDVKVGDEWPTASNMFRSLMGHALADDGRRTRNAGQWQQGHRMTLIRFFNLNKKAKPKPKQKKG